MNKWYVFLETVAIQRRIQLFLYPENCKSLMKEIKENTNKYMDIHVHGLEDLTF